MLCGKNPRFLIRLKSLLTINKVKAFVHKLKREVNNKKDEATKIYKQALAEHRREMAKFSDIDKFVREVDDVRNGVLSSSERAAHLRAYHSSDELKSRFAESQYLLVVSKIKGEKDLAGKDSVLRGSNVFNDYLQVSGSVGTEMDESKEENENDEAGVAAKSMASYFESDD